MAKILPMNPSKLKAWMVHFYTSLGLITGLMAMIAIVNQDTNLAFFWLGIALVIDATDGTMARKFNVSFWTPNFDGRKLDDITDYLNYAFIPIFFVWRFEIISGLWLIVLPLVLLSAVYGFCQTAAKTDDGYFTGFPNYWNLVVLYLFIFQWPVFVNGIIFLILAILIFMPVKFVSYSTPGKKSITKGLSVIYLILLVLMFVLNSQLVGIISLIFPFLYFSYAVYLKVNQSDSPVLVE